MRTPRNITQHELIGLRCSVVKAQNPSSVGLRGDVIDETMKTLVLEGASGRKRVQKAGSVFRFQLDEAAVEVDGDIIVARPEDRIKKRPTRW